VARFSEKSLADLLDQINQPGVKGKGSLLFKAFKSFNRGASFKSFNRGGTDKLRCPDNERIAEQEKQSMAF